MLNIHITFFVKSGAIRLRIDFNSFFLFVLDSSEFSRTTGVLQLPGNLALSLVRSSRPCGRAHSVSDFLRMSHNSFLRVTTQKLQISTAEEFIYTMIFLK